MNKLIENNSNPIKWVSTKPAHIPRPTYWPAVLAVGVTCLLWGIASTWVIGFVGFLLSVMAINGWIGELRNARTEK